MRPELEHLQAIAAAAEDVTHRADRIREWREMKHRFAVEGGLRTQGLRAERHARALHTLALAVTRCCTGEESLGNLRDVLRGALRVAAEEVREVGRRA